MNAAARRERELRAVAAAAARVRIADAHPLRLAIDATVRARRELELARRALVNGRFPEGLADGWLRELRGLELGCIELAAALEEVRHRALSRMLDGADAETRRLHGLEST